MEILTGLFDNMVLQMNRQQKSDTEITGLCQGSGTVLLKVTKADRTIKGFNWAKVGIAAKGKFAAKLKGIPAGGPYDISLGVENKAGQLIESADVHNVLTGEVWILGGQSNMQGCGLLADAEKPDPMIRAFYMTDKWDDAKDPLHQLGIAVDPVHRDLGAVHEPKPVTGTGPAVSFAKKMYELSGMPQGLIVCAHGGTTMQQWDPALKKLGGKSLYGAMYRRFVKNGSRVAGVLWYQGCSDANQPEARKYTARMKKLIAAMRKDFTEPKLPVAIVQIGCVASGGWENLPWTSIRDQQHQLPQIIDDVTCSTAVDLQLEDPIHLSGKAQQTLGYRLANAMQVLRLGKKAGLPPISVKKVSFRRIPNSECTQIIIDFDNVQGSLQAQGLPSGFSIIEAAEVINCIYRTNLKSKSAIIYCSLPQTELQSCQLAYGFGCNPYCNITDQANRALNAFGPILLGKPRAISPFITTLKTSKLLHCAEKLDSLNYPKSLASLKLKTETFAQRFCQRREELAANPDGLVYYACKIDCCEPMKLRLLLGYDGPIKLWLDKGQCLHDPNGTNPAVYDEMQIDFNAEKGQHDILIALSANNGNAYGIFLRIQRLDITQTQIKKGPETYAMPQIIA